VRRVLVRGFTAMVAMVTLLLGWAPRGYADETSDFEKARIAYVKRDYVEAVARFEAMLDPQNGTLKTKDLITEAEFCFGAVRFAQGRKDDAHKLWEKVIRESNGQYQPDPLTYPSDVLNDFIDERTRMNDEIKRQQQNEQSVEAIRRKKEAEERAKLEARVRELEGLAGVETVVIQNSRWAALVPFGVGQFQNGSGHTALGWVFLLTEGIGVASTFALIFPWLYNVDQFNAAVQGPGSMQYRQNLANQYAAVADNIRTADFILLGAVGVLAITGIIEAELAFKPIVTFTRKRKLTSVWPSLAPLPNGAALGLHGTF
jgi:tetratricopeptide (TPR) repeat protein